MSRITPAGFVSTPSTLTPLSSNRSENGGRAHGHGAQSHRAMDDSVVAGDDQFHSVVAEPPTSDDTSEPAERADEAAAPIPLTLDVNEESTALHEENPTETARASTVTYSRPVYRHRANSDQLFMIGRRPDDGNLGDVPIFPDSSLSQSAENERPLEPDRNGQDSIPPGTDVPGRESERVKSKAELDNQDWFGDWTEFDEDRALLERPQSTESEKELA